MAKKGKFKCSTCGRTFSMAAHLGRHQSAVHAAKKRTRRALPGRRRHLARARAGPQHLLPAGPSGVISELRAYCNRLLAKRADIQAQLAAVGGALAALGRTAGSIAQRVTGRARGVVPRPGSLKDFIRRVLRAQGRPMRVMDITAAVRKAGYKSRNKALAKSVGVALASMRNVAKIGRGTFRLK